MAAIVKRLDSSSGWCQAISDVRFPPDTSRTSWQTQGMLYTELDSPVGPLRIVGNGDEIVSITMQDQRWAAPHDATWRRDDEAFTDARTQFEQYFAGQRREFELPLKISGTPFRVAVWRALARIPYASTCSYGELAAALGRPGAARAVGLANGRNPFAIVLPCHRVIGSGGALTGYGGGLERKAWLLDHEAAVSAGEQVHGPRSQLRLALR
jgi:methylated-DNA-[protein]-cysteine S-methyltransferase